MAVEIKHECEKCRDEADVCYCKGHFDEAIEDAYQRGKRIGYEDGYEDAKKRGQFED
jgi:flagellar biosynthesis/type III secretory pathway protein FliH